MTGRIKTDFSKIDPNNISPVYKRGKVLFTYIRRYDPPSGQAEEKHSGIIFVKAIEINTRKENRITSDPYSEDSSVQSLSAGIATLTPLTLLLKNREQKPSEGDEILMSLTVTEDVRYYNADGYCESIVKKNTSDFSIKRIFSTVEVGIKKLFENVPKFNLSESKQTEKYFDTEDEKQPYGRDTGYRNGKAYKIETVEVESGKRLSKPAAQAWLNMKEAAIRDSPPINLTARSAFRSYYEQEELWYKYQNGTGNKAASPGYSNHQSGIAIDIVEAGVSFGGYDGIAYKWLNKNGSRFGFRNTVSGEPWHWEYEGE